MSASGLQAMVPPKGQDGPRRPKLAKAMVACDMYGCNGKYQQTFESLLYGNYPNLFLEMTEIDSYERAHLLDYEINRLIEVNKIGEKCSYFSSS